MTKTMDLKALVAAGVALPMSGATKQQICYALANDYLAKGSKNFDFGKAYVQIWYVEDTAIERLRLISTTGTALEPAVSALNAVGIKIEPTLGGFMDTIGLNQDDMHALICHCSGPVHTGEQMAARFQKLGDKYANLEA